MSRLMEEYTRKAAAYEAALSKIASTNRPVNSTALLWEIKETLYAGVGKGSQASSPSDLQTLHRALNGSRVISLGAKLTQQLATVAEEAENAGVIERLGPQKAREARLALGQALCLCLDGIADAGRGLTHAGPPDHAEFMARIRNPRTHPVNDLVTDLTLPDTMKALAAAARFVRCRLWPLAEEELAAAAVAEQGQGQGEAGAGEEQGEEEASQGAGGAAAGSSAADAPPINTKVKIKRLNDSIRVMKLDPVDADSAAQLVRQAGAAGGALLLSACAALHGAVGVVRHECDVMNSATPFAQALLGSLISTQALDEIAAAFLAAPPPPQPPSAAPYTSVYCMAFMTLTDVLTDVCGLAGPCGPGPIQLLTQPALLRLRYEMLEQVAATAPGGADEGIEGIGNAGGGRGTGAAVGLAAAGGAARVRLWPVMQRDTLRAVFGPRVQLTRSMFTFVVNAAGAPIAAQQHSEAACDRAAVMAFPDRRRAVALAAAASRALAARLEHLGAAGAAEPSAEARVTPRMLYDAAQHFPPVVHALVGAAPPREAAALVGDALLMYGWLLRCLVTPAGLAGAGRGGLETDSEKLMPFCTTYTIQDSPLNDDPLFKAWRRMTPLQRAAAAARALAARIPQSMDGVARQLAAQGEVPLEAVAGSADLVTLLLRAQLQRWRARLAAALAAREEAEATEAAEGAEEGVAGAGAAVLPPLPAPPSISELGLLLTAVKVIRCEAERLAAENAAAAASSSGNSSSSGSSSSSRAALLPALLQGAEPVHWVLAEHLMRWVGHREGGLASLLPELQPAAAAAAAATAGGSSSSASKAGKGKSKSGCSTATGGGGAAAAERLALGEAQRVVLEAMALAGVAVMQLYGEMLAAAVRHWDEQDGQQAQPGSAAPPRRAAAAGAGAAAASKQELCERLAVIAVQLLVLVALLPPPVLLAAPMPPQRLMPLLARALLHVQKQLGLGGGGGDNKGGKKKQGGGGGGGGGAAAPQEWTAAMDGWRELVLRLSAEPRLCAACVPGWLWGARRTDGGKVGGGKAGGGKAGGGRREVDSLQVDLTAVAAAGVEAAAAGAGASASAAASASTPPAAAAGAAEAGTSGGGGAPGVAVRGPVLLVRGAVVASTLASAGAEWSSQAWLQHQQQVVSLAQATLRAEHRDGGGDEAAYEGWRQAAAALPGGGEEGILGPAAARLCGNPRCSNFGGASEAALELKKCTACRAVRYCGAGCQKEHWRAGHKEACRRPPPSDTAGTQPAG